MSVSYLVQSSDDVALEDLAAAAEHALHVLGRVGSHEVVQIHQGLRAGQGKHTLLFTQYLTHAAWQSPGTSCTWPETATR